MLIYQTLNSLFNCYMDMPAQRRLLLQEMIENKYAGSRKSFCDAAGISESRLAQLLSLTYRGGGEFGEKVARKLERSLQLPAFYFDRGGDADEGKPFPPHTFDKNVRPVPMGVIPVPVISAIQAGHMKEISNPYPIGAGFAVEYIDDDGQSPWTFGLEIEGDSMLPEFKEGDRVIIDPELIPGPGDFVAVRNTREEATFKKYRPRGIDANGNVVFEIVPLNPDYPTMRSDVDHLEVIGTMIEHRKKRRRQK